MERHTYEQVSIAYVSVDCMCTMHVYLGRIIAGASCVRQAAAMRSRASTNPSTQKPCRYLDLMFNKIAVVVIANNVYLGCFGS